MSATDRGKGSSTCWCTVHFRLFHTLFKYCVLLLVGIVRCIEITLLKYSFKKVFLTVKDVVTPDTHISEASRYILYTIILTFDGICTIS